MKEILKYIEDGLSIRKNNDGTYTVFTVPTQHFNISSLEELTKERFEKAVKNFKERECVENKMIRLAFSAL